MNVTFFAAIMAFVLAFAVVLLYKPGAPTAGDLERLQRGMTPEEVVAVLGEPRMSVRGTMIGAEREQLWTYMLTESRWGVVREEYQLKFFDGRLDSWWKVK
jgi:hypothetical protein